MIKHKQIDTYFGYDLKSFLYQSTFKQLPRELFVFTLGFKMPCAPLSTVLYKLYKSLQNPQLNYKL